MHYCPLDHDDFTTKGSDDKFLSFNNKKSHS